MRYIYFAKAENGKWNSKDRQENVRQVAKLQKGRQFAQERQVERMLIALDDDVFASRRLRRGREDVSFFAGTKETV